MNSNNFVIINNNKFVSELAITSEEQSLGLMYRKELPEAMSFLYRKAEVASFWMKSTLNPLDIIFSRNGIVQLIKKGEPFSTELIGGVVSDLVVELPFGKCKEFDIKVGDKIKLELSRDSRKLFFKLAKNKY